MNPTESLAIACSRRTCPLDCGPRLGGLLITLSLAMASPAHATNYNDGGTHTISGADTDVVVSNGTIVNVVPSADIHGGPTEPFASTAVQIFDGILNVTGGSMTGSSARNGGYGLWGQGGTIGVSGGTFQGGNGSSLGAGAGALFNSWGTLSISGGNFFGGQGDSLFGSAGGDGLRIDSSSPLTATISGGTFHGQPTSNADGYDLHVKGMATVDVSGGDFSYGHSAFEGNAVGNLSGGDFNFLQAFQSAQVNVNGGHVIFFVLHDSALVNINSGQIGGGSSFEDNSVVNVRGGHFNAIDFTAFLSQHAVMNVYGTGLTYQNRELKGILQDGTPIDTLVVLADQSVVNLFQIPEPPSSILGVLGFAGFAAWGSRLRKRHTYSAATPGL